MNGSSGYGSFTARNVGGNSLIAGNTGDSTPTAGGDDGDSRLIIGSTNGGCRNAGDGSPTAGTDDGESSLSAGSDDAGSTCGSSLSGNAVAYCRYHATQYMMP